jgi:hypothetical protein
VQLKWSFFDKLSIFFIREVVAAGGGSGVVD